MPEDRRPIRDAARGPSAGVRRPVRTRGPDSLSTCVLEPLQSGRCAVEPMPRAMRERLSSLGDGPPQGFGRSPCRVFAWSSLRPSSQTRGGVRRHSLAEAVGEAVPGVWRGPVFVGLRPSLREASSSEDPAYVPSLDVIIGAEVRADRLREIRDELSSGANERAPRARTPYTSRGRPDACRPRDCVRRPSRL